MTPPFPCFARMITPILPQTFFAETWEKTPLHIRRGAPGFYDALVTRRDIDAMISAGGLRFPAVQLAKGGRFLPPEAFTRTIRSGDDLFTGVPDPRRLREEYQAGATISLPGFHRAWQPLGKLVAELEDELSHAVHTNVYITPAKSPGFTPHFDTHDVFILQIAGTKHWTIRKPPLALPHRGQRFGPEISISSAPLLEIDLAPGDLLYLPRGFVHSTATAAGFSMHVTLGITVYTLVELLAEWSQAGSNRARFRRSLPPGFAASPDAAAALKADLLAMIEELRLSTDYDALLGGFINRIRSGQSAMRGDFDSDAPPTGR